jgi:hypothetical protein
MYSYTRKGKPLRHCPGCKADLTKEDAINIELVSNSGHVYETFSCLDGGVLVDVDGEVEAGNHSGTSCSSCNELLINFSGVEEIDNAI